MGTMTLFPNGNNKKKDSDWLRGGNNGIVPWWEPQGKNNSAVSSW